jgi:O-antigen/teichoic acid export membrane protein
MTSTGGGLGRRLAANTLHAATGRVASLLLWLALTPPIYRALGAEGFAVWSLFFALAGYLGSLDLGLATGAVRHVAAARARGDHKAAGGFATVAVIGYAVLGIVWLALMPLVRGPVLEFLRVPESARAAASFAFLAGAAVFVLAGLANTTIAVLQAYGRFDLGNVTALTLTLGQAAGLVWSLTHQGGVQGVVAATAAGWGLAALVGAVALRTGAPEFAWSAPRDAFGQLAESVRFGAPMQLGNMMAVAHQQLDKVLLARFVSLAAVAPYELGLRMATAASTFPQLLLLAVIPSASALHASGEGERLRELYARSNRYILMASAFVTAGLVAGAPRFFCAWLGHADDAAALALRGLLLAAYAGLTTGMAIAVARAYGRTDLEAEFSAIALAVHLALGAWLVPSHALIGALIAVTAGNVVGAAWFLSRVAGVAGWPRARMLLEPLGVPSLSLALGVAVALVLDRALPAALGAAAWPGALLVGVLAGALAVAVALLTRYLSLDEARALVRPRA